MANNEAIATPAGITQAGRWLAGAQQLKDTITILGMNFILLFGLLLFGLPIPGLILYFLRWRLVEGKSSREYAALLWGLSIIHEWLCAMLFMSSDMHNELQGMASYLAMGYWLGAAISTAGWIQALASQTTTEHAESDNEGAASC